MFQIQNISSNSFPKWQKQIWVIFTKKKKKKKSHTQNKMFDKLGRGRVYVRLAVNEGTLAQHLSLLRWTSNLTQ